MTMHAMKGQKNPRSQTITGQSQVKPRELQPKETPGGANVVVFISPFYFEKP